MHRLLLILFAVTLALVPAPLASNRDWGWSPLAVVVGLLLLGATVTLARDPEFARRTLANFRALRMPAILIALALAWAVVQATNWTPESWASSISAVPLFGPEAAVHSIVFNRELFVTGMMRLLINVGFFLLGALFASKVTDARALLGTIVIAASLYTLYAMVAQAANRAAPWSGVSIWTPFEPYFTGTFLNANNYATYTGMAAMTALALALRPRRSPTPETARQRWRRRLSLLSGMGGFWIAAALVLMAGVLFSASRAGSASLVLAGMTMAALYTKGLARVGWLVGTPLLLLVAVFTLPGGSTLVERFIRLLTEGEGGRPVIYAGTIDAIGLRPMTGWGLNSFQAVYPMLQPPSLPSTFDKAHNTYLELAFDLGIPAAAALVVAVLWIVLRCLRGYFDRLRDAELAGLGFIVAVLAGFHALFDFSLQIPAMACTFFAILGMAWAQSWSGRHGGAPEG